MKVGAWLWSYSYWRAVSIKDPVTGRSSWKGPVKLTDDAAASWRIDMQQANWNSTVSLYTYRNGRWTYGL